MNVMLAANAAPDRWLLQALREAGHHVLQSVGVIEARERINRELVAAIVIDGIADAFSWLQVLAASTSAACIVLLPAAADDCRAELIQAGAVACLQRPFTLSELMLSLELIERRRGADLPGLFLDVRRRMLHVHGVGVELTAQEFSLMDHLLRRPVPLSVAQLSRYLWDAEGADRADALRALVHRLRSKLRRQIGQPLLRSVRGAGYVLELQAPSIHSS